MEWSDMGPYVSAENELFLLPAPLRIPDQDTRRPLNFNVKAAFLGL
jgi:hypothetical protein